jgi:hypothetical protein
MEAMILWEKLELARQTTSFDTEDTTGIDGVPIDCSYLDFYKFFKQS